MGDTNLMADLVGPFNDAAGVATRLNVSVDALAVAQGDGLLLGVKASDGTWLYPVFQFAGDQVDPGLLPVLGVFRDAPQWSTAVWLCGPDSGLNGLTPIEWVRAGNDPGVVVSLARRTANSWAS